MFYSVAYWPSELCCFQLFLALVKTSFKRIKELKWAFKADDEEALSGLINMNRELPKTVNIGMIDLGVEFNASYCSMLAAQNLGLTSMENQCEKTALYAQALATKHHRHRLRNDVDAKDVAEKMLAFLHKEEEERQDFKERLAIEESSDSEEDAVEAAGTLESHCQRKQKGKNRRPRTSSGTTQEAPAGAVTAPPAVDISADVDGPPTGTPPTADAPPA